MTNKKGQFVYLSVRFLFCLAVVILVIGLCFGQFRLRFIPPKIIYIQDPNYVQPPCEAQRRLREQGLYHGKIDNIWGVKTDKAYCDYCAIQEIEGR